MTSQYNILPLALGDDYYVLARSGLLIPPLKQTDASVVVSLPAIEFGLSIDIGTISGSEFVSLPPFEFSLSVQPVIHNISIHMPALSMGLSMSISDVLLTRYIALPPIEFGLSAEFGDVLQSVLLPSLDMSLDIDATVLQSTSLPPFSLGFSLDFGEALTFKTGAAIIRYYCVITGAADGTTDVTLPMSSFQSRRRSGDPTYLSVVIPTVDYADEIADRQNGTIKIQQAYEQNGVIQQVETIIETDLDSIDTDDGGTSQSVTLTGYSTASYDAKSITLSGVTYRSTRAGKYHYRLAKPYIFLDPGDTVTFSEDGVSFEIDTMSYFINATTSTIELASV